MFVSFYKASVICLYVVLHEHSGHKQPIFEVFLDITNNAKKYEISSAIQSLDLRYAILNVWKSPYVWCCFI